MRQKTKFCWPRQWHPLGGINGGGEDNRSNADGAGDALYGESVRQIPRASAATVGLSRFVCPTVLPTARARMPADV
jgi:hypothetical protein